MPVIDRCVPTTIRDTDGSTTMRAGADGMTFTSASPNAGLLPGIDAATVTRTLPRYPAFTSPVSDTLPSSPPVNQRNDASGSTLPLASYAFAASCRVWPTPSSADAGVTSTRSISLGGAAGLAGGGGATGC